MHAYTKKIILLKQRKKADGTYHIYAQAFVNGERVRIPLYQYVKESQWNDSREAVVRHIDSENINLYIDQVKQKIESIFLSARLKDRPLYKSSFMDAFTANQRKNTSYIAFMKDEITKQTAILAKNTIRNHTWAYNIVKEIYGDISFNEIDRGWLEQLEGKLIKKKYPVNGRAAIHKVLKVYMNRALDAQLLTFYPYEKFTVKKAKPTRDYLEVSELQQVQKLYDQSKNRALTNAAGIFLFMAYTSVRIGDAVNLTWSNVRKDILVFSPEKNVKRITALSIPLNDKALVILGERKSDNEPLFKIPSQQKINQRLKSIAQILNIDKTITCHVARHTFATLALQAGVDIVRVQKLLGHSDIKTTMVYTHVNLEGDKKAMKLLNDFYDKAKF